MRSVRQRGFQLILCPKIVFLGLLSTFAVYSQGFGVTESAWLRCDVFAFITMLLGCSEDRSREASVRPRQSDTPPITMAGDLDRLRRAAPTDGPYVLRVA